MSREDFLARIKNMDPLEHAQTTQKAEEQNTNLTSRLDAKRNMKKIANVAKTVGIGKTFTSSSGGVIQREPIHHSAPAGNAPTHHAPEAPSRRGFSVYNINEVDIANARDYYSSVDGKGDPEIGD